MPAPVHPDDPLVSCRFCPQVFLARSGKDRDFAKRHEDACEENPERIFHDAGRNWQVPNTGSFNVTQTVSTATSPPIGGVPYYRPDDWQPSF